MQSNETSPPAGASAGVDAPTTRVVQGVCERCNRDAYLAVDAFGMRCWRCDLDHYRSALAAERAAGEAATARVRELEKAARDALTRPSADTLEALRSVLAARALAADRETEEEAIASRDPEQVLPGEEFEALVESMIGALQLHDDEADSARNYPLINLPDIANGMANRLRRMEEERAALSRTADRETEEA